jgi:hypothetical protein
MKELLIFRFTVFSLAPRLAATTLKTKN